MFSKFNPFYAPSPPPPSLIDSPIVGNTIRSSCLKSFADRLMVFMKKQVICQHVGYTICESFTLRLLNNTHLSDQIIHIRKSDEQKVMCISIILYMFQVINDNSLLSFGILILEQFSCLDFAK